MHLLKALISSFVIVIVVTACKDNTPHQKSTEVEANISTFSPLQVGNFWIYERYRITTDGSTKFEGYDTVSIVKDTLISNQQYFLRSSTFLGHPQEVLLYHSNNSLYTYPDSYLLLNLDPDLVSPIDYQSEYLDTLISGQYQLIREKENVSVPAGDFNCINYKGKIDSKDAEDPFTRYCNNYYAEDIGLVQASVSFLSFEDYIEIRLLEYGKQ